MHIEPGPAVEFALIPGQRVELSVSAEGIVRLRVATEESTPLPQAVEQQPIAPPQLQEPADSGHGQSGRVPQPVVPPVAESPVRKPERQPRETFRGIVSTHPRLEQTPKGVPKTVFRLATHPDENTTIHVPCVAFDNQRQHLAQQVYQRVHKGEAVEVVGYRHERQLRPQQGQTHQMVEVYVTAVRHQKDAQGA
jgi:hypothetical protein